MSKMVCTVCGSVSEPRSITKGSTFIELILWLCFIIPGLVYSVWRLSSRYEACRECESTSIVPIDTPVGRNLVATHHPEKDLLKPRESNAENIGRALGRMFAHKKKP
jgi:hypothetical protein